MLEISYRSTFSSSRRLCFGCCSFSLCLPTIDDIYGERVTRKIESLGIDEVVTAPASPWQNAYVERVIGTIRRGFIDHVYLPKAA